MADFKQKSLDLDEVTHEPSDIPIAKLQDLEEKVVGRMKEMRGEDETADIM